MSSVDVFKTTTTVKITIAVLVIVSFAVAASRRTKSQSHPQPAERIRTLRIHGLRPNVTREELQASLLALCKERSLHPEDDLRLSLCPFNGQQVATVTFLRGEPAAFSGCKPGNIWPVSIDGVGEDLVVDCDFLGVTPVYCGQAPRVDIVAVSSGHAFGSWNSRQSNSMWLRDFLPGCLEDQQVRILTFGFQYSLDQDTATAANSLEEYARQLLEHIGAARCTEAEKIRPIVFIGHSMGGLVIKQALVDARPPYRGSTSDHAILRNTAGMLFFAVPHRGLNTANLASVAPHRDTANLLHDIRESSPLLNRLQHDFIDLFEGGLLRRQCIVTSFFETKDTASVIIKKGKLAREGPEIRMVSEGSATWATPWEAIYDQVPIPRDHFGIVRFASPYDAPYLVVKARLVDMVEEAASAEDRDGKQMDVTGSR